MALFSNRFITCHYQKCLFSLIILYIIASFALFIVFNSIIPIQLYSLFEHNYSSHERHWRHFNACSNEYREIMGQKNYVCTWWRERKSDSTGNYVIFGREFALLKEVIIDPLQGEGHVGGENMSSVWNQAENSEYYKFRKSYFQLPCAQIIPITFTGVNHLNDWVGSLSCLNSSTPTSRAFHGLTIAVQRYEYVNLYHTMTDYYNAFLIMILFNKSPTDINILFIDGHPSGSLDPTWSRLFNKVYRAGALTTKTKFTNLVWGIQGYNSPLNNHDLPFVPYLEKFREFFLIQHKVDLSKTLNCSRLSILIIWRRDYVAHPRNPSGIISRKIQNEEELFKAISHFLPDHNVTALQLDVLPMPEQLKLISKTDILIGMHGAGLTHTLFLPKHAGLIEFYPTYWPDSNRHFHALASWRQLHYLNWKNHDVSNEFDNKLTYIPPHPVINMIKQMTENLCPSVILE